MGRFERAIDVPYEVGNAVKRFRISRPWMLEGLPYVEHVRGLAEGPPVDAFLLKVASPTGARGYLEVDFVSHLRDGNNWRIVTKKPRFHDLPAGMAAIGGAVSFAASDSGCRIAFALDIDGFEPGNPVVDEACDTAVAVFTEQMAKRNHWI